jgi:hypothetical protein
VAADMMEWEDDDESFFSDAMERGRLEVPEPAARANKHGIVVPGWFLQNYAHLDIDDFEERPPSPWEKALPPSAYRTLYSTPAKLGECCMGTRIFHNGLEYRAAMKKYGQTECECFSGVNMTTGKANGENLIKYATLEERVRVKEHMMRINERRNQHSKKMTEEAKKQWDRQCTRERKLVQSQAIAHWKHLRQMDVERPSGAQTDAVEQRQQKHTKKKVSPSGSKVRGTKRQQVAEKAFPEEAASSVRPKKQAKEALKDAYKAVREARNEIRLDKK